MRLFPFAVLAGEFELRGEKDADDNVIENPAPQIERCRASLGPTTVELYNYWTRWRQGRLPTTTVQPGHEIGRNDKCTCGSGIKYKKCCALKVH